ncbi:MAG: hypothetical protein SH868_04295 [Bythopirellula sp.]|nr:hypothetical protein [Bythopirellula sp.]
MIKKLAILLALVAGFAIADTPDANAWGYRRIAPVRRVLGPPYPIARRAVVGPVYRRSFYRAPVVFAPTPVVSGGVFFGF